MPEFLNSKQSMEDQQGVDDEDDQEAQDDLDKSDESFGNIKLKQKIPLKKRRSNLSKHPEIAAIRSLNPNNPNDANNLLAQIRSNMRVNWL